MADAQHPKAHVEDQDDIDLPRVQPISPKHEGIDPLTESDTMYPRDNTKADSEKLSHRAAPAPVDEPETTDEFIETESDAEPTKGKRRFF